MHCVQDAPFLELEEADPSGAPTLGAVRELLLERLSAMPRSHQRLSDP